MSAPAAVLLLSVALSIAVVVAHQLERSATEQSTAALRKLAQARADLAEGQMLVLVGGPTHGPDADAGATRIRQASDELGGAARLIGIDVRHAELSGALARFESAFSAWRATPASGPTAMRIELDALVRTADEIQSRSRERHLANLDRSRGILATVIVLLAASFAMVAWWLATAERRQAAAARLVGRLGAVVDELATPVAYIDRARVVRAANRACADWTGRPVSALLGRRADETLGGGLFDAEAIARLEECLAGRSPRAQRWVRRPDGASACLDIAWTPVLGADGTVDGAALVTHDVTTRADQERQLRIALGQLEQRNEDLRQLARAASHDLQEPLKSVGSLLGLLQHRLASSGDPETETLIERIVAAMVRMRRRLQGVFALSELERLEPTMGQVDLGVVLRDVVDGLASKIGSRGAEVAIDVMPSVHGNAALLAELFRNLVDNALEFRKPGQPPRVRIGCEPLPHGWRVSVEDDGIGIPPGERDRVFALFRRGQACSDHAGEGVGLAVSRKIAELHGGRISIEPAAGSGTIVHVDLRTTAESLAGPDVAAAHASRQAKFDPPWFQ